MAHSSSHLLVFGDQVIDKRPMIRSLIRNSKSSCAARVFLQEATDLVQVELAQLSPDEHGWPGNFESLLALAEEHAALEANNSALLYVSSLTALIGRLGDLIVRAERDPSILGSKDRPIHVLALCAGQIPAAAAVAARDTSELLTIAREIISVACRWMRVIHRNRLAMISPHHVGGWSITYTGLDRRRMQQILDDFHAAHEIPALHKVAISVVSRSWLTLVGPSSSLQRLAEFSQEIRRAPQVPADAGVPAHSPFMAGVDADGLVGHSMLLDRALDWEKVRMVSPSGDCLERRFDTLHDLLLDIFEDILKRPLLVDDTIESVISNIDENTRVHVHEIGQTTHMPLVIKTLAAVGLASEVIPPYQPPVLGSTPSRGNSDLVAIVGMSGRFPGSDNVSEFWTELMKGTCHIKKVPSSRYDVDRYYDATQKLKNSVGVKDGAWLNDPGFFDNRFFNISPREAMQMDPAQRLCLTVTHEALEMAGYAPNASPSMDPERVSTWIGSTSSDWPENLHEMGTDIYYVSSSAKAFLSGKINYHYKFGRGSYSIDSVCASSTTAISLACKSLLGRDSDMAVAGGASVFSAPLTTSGLARSGMLAPEGGCRTFHDDADGYVRGEGIGVVILKRLEDAVADRDNILGVIGGSARMYSTTSTSITHPSHTSQEKIYREVLGQTALDPEEITYVEMHGTGTQAGDFEELTSVLNVMGGQRMANNSLTMGAVKAAMGHGEGVAGVTSLIKILLMLQHRTIPSQPGVPFKMNHRFPPMDKRNVHLALETQPLRASPKAADGKIKLLVNTFDASGGNCSLVIQEAPDTDYGRGLRPEDVRSFQVVALSARSTYSLQHNCENLLAYLENNPDTRLADLAYTTTTRRMHSTLRKAFVCRSVEDLVGQLRQQSTDDVKKLHSSRVVLLFTGQGSQYQSMGMSLFKTSMRFRELIEAYQLTASHLDLPQFLPIISGAMDITTASPTQVQLAILALELAMAHMLRLWGIVPSVVIGHSLGEYAALCVSGVLSPSDALYLVGRRALLMEKHLRPNTYAMLATPLDAEGLTARIKEENESGRLSSCAAACLNAPNVTVASGTVADIRALQDVLTREGMHSTLLHVPFGFHSAQVEPILRDFERIATGVTFKKPNIPVASTLSGQLVDVDGVFGPSYLARQTREPVKYVAALRAVEASGYAAGNATMWVETGPDAVCLGLVRKTLGVDAARLLPAMKPQKDNWETVCGVLRVAYEMGMPIDWKNYHGEFIESLGLLSDLPAYHWEYKNYWTTYTAASAWEVEKALAAVGGDNDDLAEKARSIDHGFSQTLSVHRVVEESRDESAGTISIIFSSDTSAPGLIKAAEGHIVCGHSIMPLTVFCDMATTCAKHCYFRVHNSTIDSTRFAVQDITISNAVIVSTNSKPVLLTTASYSQATETVEITFHKAGGGLSSRLSVGRCRIKISTDVTPNNAVPGLNQSLFFVKTRMQQLRDQALTGKAHRLLREVVYRLFGAYVKYGPEFQSMDEVIVSQGSLDALATITAPMGADGVSGVVNPWVHDGVNQLTGFLLNNSLRCPDDRIIYIFEGFAEQHQWERLIPGRRYTTYATGQDTDDTGSSVDLTSYVFDAETGKLVHMLTGVRATKVKKVVLNHILGSARSAPQPSDHLTGHAHVPIHGLPSLVVTPSDLIKGQTAVEVTSVKAIVPTTDLHVRHTTPLIDRVLATVAAEVGVSPKDMTDDTLFGDLGVDSLMSISVLSTVRNELGLSLSPLFFIEHETVGAARQTLQHMQGADAEDITPSSSASSVGDDRLLAEATPGFTSDESQDSSVGDPEETDTEDRTREEETKTAWVHIEALIETPSEPVTIELDRITIQIQPTTVEPEPETLPPPPLPDAVAADAGARHEKCKIMLLQGDPQQDQPALPPLFLLADQSGSSVSYVQLPRLDGRCVYGVDWPADADLERPDLVSSLADAMSSSVADHPVRGPCILGGVAFGAVLALEVGRRMDADAVAGVLLLDPPAAPGDIVRAPSRLAAATAAAQRPRPVQALRTDAAVRALEGYSYEGRDVKAGGPVMLMVPETGGTPGRWDEWLPAAEVRVVDGAQAGAFWRFPTINAVGSVCREVVAGMDG